MLTVLSGEVTLLLSFSVSLTGEANRKPGFPNDASYQDASSYPSI
jgi:hypothetical protein